MPNPISTDTVLDWDFLGNAWALKLLQGQLANQSLSHAYLLTGPDGIGRRTLALKLAQAVICEHPPAAGQYCGECRTCRRVLTMQHPDLHLLELQEGDRKIKIDAVRELSRMLSLTPFEAHKQIALLLDFEQASDGAANALLKTLEEPSASVLLLLTAESAESLPATIASRCEVFNLRPMPEADLQQALVARGVAEQLAQQAARFSSGRPGLAVQLLEQEGALEQRQAWAGELLELLGSSQVERFAYAQEISRDREELVERLGVWLAWWRELLLAKNGSGTLPSSEVGANLERLNRQDVRTFVDALQGSLAALRGNVNLRLTMESLLLGLPKST